MPTNRGEPEPNDQTPTKPRGYPASCAPDHLVVIMIIIVITIINIIALLLNILKLPNTKQTEKSPSQMLISVPNLSGHCH
jgi:hypothetical protein